MACKHLYGYILLFIVYSHNNNNHTYISYVIFQELIYLFRRLVTFYTVVVHVELCRVCYMVWYIAFCIYLYFCCKAISWNLKRNVRYLAKSSSIQCLYRKVEDLQFKLEEEEITLGDELQVFQTTSLPVHTTTVAHRGNTNLSIPVQIYVF